MYLGFHHKRKHVTKCHPVFGRNRRIILKQVFKNTMAGYGWMNIVQDRGHWWTVVGIS